MRRTGRAGAQGKQASGAQSDLALLEDPVRGLPPHVGELKFVVPGPPVPKKRPRVVAIPLGKGQGGKAPKFRVSTYTPAETVAYEKLVATHCTKMIRELETVFDEKWDVLEPSDLFLQVVVYRATLRGDADNFCKAVSDGLNGVAYPDDKYIFGLRSLMTLDRENPRVEVLLRKWPLGTFSGWRE